MSTLTGTILADFTTSLASAMAVGATSATLQSATDDDGVALPTGTYYFTIDGSNSSKEHIRCTLTSTALTSIYSVSRQGVATSGCARAHRLGATVTLTDFAHLKVINDLINGTTNLNASEPLEYDGTATINANNQLATKAYVDGVAIAGGADASTTVKGLTKMSVAPASAATPIAVGDNDPRVPTTGENDALVGTSGTPSSSNKYVTADDVASDGTASKIIRASGTASTFPSSFILDEDTMSSDSATKPPSQQSVKAYVDNNVKYVPNALPTYTGGYYTYEAPFLEHLDGATYRWSGWTANSITPTALTGAGGLANFSISTSGSIYTVMPGFTSSHTAGMYFSYIGSNFISVKGRFSVGLGSSPRWGFGFVDDANGIYNTYNSTANDGARFIYDGSTLYCATSDTGVGATTNTITGVTITDSNIYQIDISSASVKFYVNGVLKFTHTTNLPNATTTAKITTGVTAGSASNVNAAPIIITIPLSAS